MEIPDGLLNNNPKDDDFWKPVTKRRITAADWRKAAIKCTVIGSIMFYVLFTFIIFEKEDHKAVVKVFGFYPEPFMPARYFSWLVFNILYIPVPYFSWHANTVLMKGMEEGVVRGKYSDVVYLFSVHEYHPSLRRSQLIAISGIAYTIIAMLVWLACTT
ncbi:hypothetical protein [Singulisphaera sp. PoT]|uniref:hypothetical protein n=1 Tax=Singulisphaera sp. PoT TaxID=3411797 RepID=UPI003BF4C05C